MEDRLQERAAQHVEVPDLAELSRKLLGADREEGLEVRPMFRSQRNSFWSMPGLDNEDWAILLGDGAGSDVRVSRRETGKCNAGAAGAIGDAWVIDGRW